MDYGRWTVNYSAPGHWPMPIFIEKQCINTMIRKVRLGESGSYHKRSKTHTHTSCTRILWIWHIGTLGKWSTLFMAVHFIPLFYTPRTLLTIDLNQWKLLDPGSVSWHPHTPTNTGSGSGARQEHGMPAVLCSLPHISKTLTATVFHSHCEEVSIQFFIIKVKAAEFWD